MYFPVSGDQTLTVERLAFYLGVGRYAFLFGIAMEFGIRISDTTDSGSFCGVMVMLSGIGNQQQQHRISIKYRSPGRRYFRQSNQTVIIRRTSPGQNAHVWLNSNHSYFTMPSPIISWMMMIRNVTKDLFLNHLPIIDRTLSQRIFIVYATPELVTVANSPGLGRWRICSSLSTLSTAGYYQEALDYSTQSRTVRPISVS